MSLLDKLEKNIRTISCLLKKRLHNDEYILIKAPIKISKGKLVPFNWGDDMNYYLVEMISGKKVLHLPDSMLLRIIPAESYLVVGSTMTFYSLDHVTVWGTGIINTHKIPYITGKPTQICAVRGPLTRAALIEKGYDCPMVYGDPILLISQFYQPSVARNQHEYGIIPHYSDKNNPTILELKDRGIKVIDIQKYNRWQDFVDDIYQCKYIVSSSLHGLIVAESYGIPSVWVGFSDYIDGWDFKFRDYYLSLQKKDVQMIPISKAEDVFSEQVLITLQTWRKGSINLDLLLSSCPFYGEVHE